MYLCAYATYVDVFQHEYVARCENICVQIVFVGVIVCTVQFTMLRYVGLFGGATRRYVGAPNVVVCAMRCDAPGATGNGNMNIIVSTTQASGTQTVAVVIVLVVAVHMAY